MVFWIFPVFLLSCNVSVCVHFDLVTVWIKSILKQFFCEEKSAYICQRDNSVMLRRDGQAVNLRSGLDHVIRPFHVVNASATKTNKTNEHFFRECKLQFLSTRLLQGSVATCVNYGRIFIDSFAASLLQSVVVKEFWKLVSISQSYRQNWSGTFFSWTRCIDNNKITETSRFGSCTLYIGVDELTHFLDNAKVRKTDSEWRCTKCEIFHIAFYTCSLLRFCTFTFYNFPFAGGISWNYTDNPLSTNGFPWVEHSSIHICTMQFILLSVHKNTVCIVISCLIAHLNWNWT